MTEEKPRPFDRRLAKSGGGERTVVGIRLLEIRVKADSTDPPARQRDLRTQAKVPGQTTDERPHRQPELQLGNRGGKASIVGA